MSACLHTATAGWASLVYLPLGVGRFRVLSSSLRMLQGQALGCGAHLTVLRRESIGEHSVASAWVLADLLEAAQRARVL